MATKTPTPAGVPERSRRAQQSVNAKASNRAARGGTAAVPTARALDPDSLEAIAAQLTPEQQAAIEAEVQTLNLDELVAEPFPVKYRTYLSEEVEDEDGTKRTVRRPVTRTAWLDPLVPAKLQLQALAFRKMSSLPEEEKMQRMAELVVDAWNRTEPGMTYERLIDGLSLERISAIFARFFRKATDRTQTTAQPVAPTTHA